MSVNFDIVVESSGCGECGSKRRGNSSHAITAKVKKIMKNPVAPKERWIGFSKTMTNDEGADIRRRSRSHRVECKAPWESRCVEGDGHVMATCGFMRPCSFTEDDAFHRLIVTRYGRGGGVGRGLGVGINLGVGLGQGGGK